MYLRRERPSPSRNDPFRGGAAALRSPNQLGVASTLAAVEFKR